MTPDEVLAVVRQAVVTVLEVAPATVTRETRFKDDLKADSLALVEIVEIVEEALAPEAQPGFHIEDEDLDGLTTVGSTPEHVTAHMKEESQEVAKLVKQINFEKM